MQNYDAHRNVYKPEVIDSKLLSRNGNSFKIYLRLLKKKVLTVVLNTEHAVEYFQLSKTRAYSMSRSTRIAEVDNPGKPSEREIEQGGDHGFLWNINSYWRFEERDGGVYIEWPCDLADPRCARRSGLVGDADYPQPAARVARKHAAGDAQGFAVTLLSRQGRAMTAVLKAGGADQRRSVLRRGDPLGKSFEQ